jgi:Flp pilus assembly pilin Flp
MMVMISIALLATLTTLQEVGIIAGVVVGTGTILFAAVNAWLSIRNERKRTQPIVIAHQDGPRRSIEHSKRSAFDMYTSRTRALARRLTFGSG